MRQRLSPTDERYAALRDVYRGKVRYHSGLSGPALGYDWHEDVGGHMFQQRRDTLYELWSRNLIDIATHTAYPPRGHEVSVTTTGFTHLLAWSGVTDTGLLHAS